MSLEQVLEYVQNMGFLHILQILQENQGIIFLNELI